ncbi:MAG: TfoX/Sxy family protein [Tropicimonas sp.]|uniref:TfoX/Sxy family protein n=1 Tax=Tropicimonas sp. TaxID=2067044 RepID=UPI003A84569E
MEELADLIREDLGLRDGLSEKRMFGGVAFMVDGNMLAGVLSGGAIYRVGKEGVEAALALEGVERMQMGARTMGGYVVLNAEGMSDPAQREALLQMALAFHATLPRK